MPEQAPEQNPSKVEGLSNADQLALEHRKLDLEERRIANEARSHQRSWINQAITFVLGAGMVAAIQAFGNRSVQNADNSAALLLQQEAARLALEQQDRKQQFEIIVQATKDVKRDIASENLLFFVEAGILTDDGGKIQAMAERGAAPELGIAPQVNDFSTSEDGVSFLKRFIPLRLESIVRADGLEIVGYNHLVAAPVVTLSSGRTVDLSDGQVTVEEAEAILRHDIEDVETSINTLTRTRLTQSQFDALVSFVANIGPHAFETSDVLRAINQGQFDQVPELMRGWVNVSNREVQSLEERRDLEAALWQQPLP